MVWEFAWCFACVALLPTLWYLLPGARWSGVGLAGAAWLGQPGWGVCNATKMGWSRPLLGVLPCDPCSVCPRGVGVPRFGGGKGYCCWVRSQGAWGRWEALGQVSVLEAGGRLPICLSQ